MTPISPYIPQIAAASPYSSMGSWGQMGSGTYGAAADYLNPLGSGSPLMGGPTAPMSLMSSPSPIAMDATRVLPPGSGDGMFSGLKGLLTDSGFLGSTNADGIKTEGWGGAALGVGQGIANAYMGMKQYGLAKEQLAEGKRQFEQNYAAQKTTTNAQLEDRQRARVASNPGAYQSVGAYMGQNGIK